MVRKQNLIKTFEYNDYNFVIEVILYSEYNKDLKDYYHTLSIRDEDFKFFIEENINTLFLEAKIFELTQKAKSWVDNQNNPEDKIINSLINLGFTKQ